MVLVTHHTQSSYVLIPFKTTSWSKVIRLKHNGIQCQRVLPNDGAISLNHAFPVRPVPVCVREVKRKPLQISSFKRNFQNDDAGDSSNKLPRNSVKFPTVSQVTDGFLSDSPIAHDSPVSCGSQSDKNISGSKAIHILFKKWLNILHTGAPNEIGNDMLDVPPKIVGPLNQKAANAKERGETLKVVLCYFLGLDATVTIPLIIFIPLYLAVNVMYGAEVSRELAPLWIIGPLVVALYVKLFRKIAALYVVSFKQTVKVFKNLPTYYSIAYQYILEGKLKEEILNRVSQPIIKLKNAGYKELLKAFQEWLTEKYLDFIESIWPLYCRIKRFLKSANFI